MDIMMTNISPSTVSCVFDEYSAIVAWSGQSLKNIYTPFSTTWFKILPWQELITVRPTG